MRSIILPAAVLALAWVVTDKPDTTVAQSGATQQPAGPQFAAAPTDPPADKAAPRTFVPAEVPKRSAPVLIDDTQQQQEPPPALPAHRAQGVLPGRFWLQALPNNYFIVIDTHSGHCWQRALSDKAWTDMGSPAAQK
jgi:hypothetical protein